MVLTIIYGELGSGKTLTQTYLIWRQWFWGGKKIYSNYPLFKIPYVPITTMNQFMEMREGAFGGDEFWLVIDSRLSQSKRNRMASILLLRSRRRKLHIFITSQTLDQVDKRIRKITDFSMYPCLNADKTICKVIAFKTGYPKPAFYMHTFYYPTKPVFEMYDTYAEPFPLSAEPDDTKEYSFVFQESMNSKPKIFKSWEEADKHGREYWKNLVKNPKFRELLTAYGR